MFRVWFDLIQYIIKDFRVDESFGSLRLWTKAACQITDARNFNIYFLERFQLRVPILPGGTTVLPSFVVRPYEPIPIISG
ncbi:hypothetical protein D3C75_1327820 [compost metagenome]